MSEKNQNPSDIARETLKTLATRKIPPTPDNYARIYAEISGTPEESGGADEVLRGIAEKLAQDPKTKTAGVALKKAIGAQEWKHCLREIENILPGKSAASSLSWSELIRTLLQQLEMPHKGLTLTRKKEGVETVLRRFAANPEVLHEKLANLIRSWSDSSINAASIIEIDPATATVPATKSDPSTEMIGQLSELLVNALENMVTAQPEMTLEAQTLIQQVRNSKTHEQITGLANKLREFWIKAELRGGDKTRIHEGLVRLLRLLVANVMEMVDGEEWLHGQIRTFQEIIANPIDKNAIADAERSLRDAIIRQGTLKQGLTDAKSTLKSLMVTFIDRLGEITESTGDYHQKIEGYTLKIGQSSNIAELSNVLDDIMQDTRIIRDSAQLSHEELLNSRKQADEAEKKIRQLEQALAEVSEMVHEDQLTGALNRRGLDEAFERETSRSDRNKTPLCVALLDIDDFKRLNDTLGHQAGDQALMHLSKVIQDTLRPSDTVSRYGGEEFVLLLPGIELKDAAEAVERLQRELTRKYFLHDNERILVTFSAGVAMHHPDESQENILARADKAMYQAKRAGKNRVVAAQ